MIIFMGFLQWLTSTKPIALVASDINCIKESCPKEFEKLKLTEACFSCDL